MGCYCLLRAKCWVFANKKRAKDLGVVHRDGQRDRGIKVLKEKQSFKMPGLWYGRKNAVPMWKARLGFSFDTKDG